jgi:peptide/nickel transport system permease protein
VLQLIGRRLLVTVPIAFLVSLLVFAMVLLVPGDPAATLAGENATSEQIAETRERLGLDDPLLTQYGRWASSAVTGDLGQSLFSGQQVTEAVVQRLPATLSLTGGALVVAVLIGLPCGVLAATNRGRPVDRVLSLLAAGGVAMPNYFLGMLLILVFAVWNELLPATRYVPLDQDPVLWLRHLVLPAVTLGVVTGAVVTRQLRSSLIGVLQQDYVETARAKGLRSRAVVLKHALKNAAIPVVTVLGTQVAFLLGGSVIVEQVFGIPGIGQLAVNAVLQRDLPVIQGVVVLTTVIVLACNLVIDVAYGYLNPRVRVQ